MGKWWSPMFAMFVGFFAAVLTGLLEDGLVNVVKLVEQFARILVRRLFRRLEHPTLVWAHCHLAWQSLFGGEWLWLWVVRRSENLLLSSGFLCIDGWSWNLLNQQLGQLYRSGRSVLEQVSLRVALDQVFVDYLIPIIDLCLAIFVWRWLVRKSSLNHNPWWIFTLGYRQRSRLPLQCWQISLILADRFMILFPKKLPEDLIGAEQGQVEEHIVDII